MSLSRKLLVYKYMDNPHLGQSNKRNIGHVSTCCGEQQNIDNLEAVKAFLDSTLNLKSWPIRMLMQF